MPAKNSVSATVLAPTAARADALATAFSVLKPEEAIQLADHLPDVEALIVFGNKDSKKAMKSAGWDRYRRKTQE